MQGDEKMKSDASSDGGDVDDGAGTDDGGVGGDNAKSPRLNLSTEATRSKSEQDLGRAHSLVDLLVVC